MVRLQPRAAGAFAVALWLLGTAQCFTAPRLNDIARASRITSSRSTLPLSTCVRQSGRGGCGVTAYYPQLVVSSLHCVASASGGLDVSLLSIVDVFNLQSGVTCCSCRYWVLTCTWNLYRQN